MKHPIVVKLSGVLIFQTYVYTEKGKHYKIYGDHEQTKKYISENVLEDFIYCKVKSKEDKVILYWGCKVNGTNISFMKVTKEFESKYVTSNFDVFNVSTIPCWVVLAFKKITKKKVG
jgi:hypothetical protein